MRSPLPKRMQSRTVSGLVKSFFHEFDALEVATNVATRRSPSPPPDRGRARATSRGASNSTRRRRSLSPQEMARDWKRAGREASCAGIEMHRDIYNFYQSGIMKATREFRLFLQFHDRVEQMGYVPLASEKKVCDPELHLTGVVDMLYVHKSNLRTRPTKVWLIDWKRSKEIKTEGYNGMRGFPPLDQLQDCNGEHYTMQLNLYKWLLEKSCGYLVVMMSIVVLHPEKQVYSIHHSPERQDLVYKMLKTLEK